VRQDFFSGPRGVEESLENIASQFDTDRHVFVGVDEDDEAVAEATGWEFLHVEDAAEAAGWILASDEPDEGDAPEEPSRDDWP